VEQVQDIKETQNIMNELDAAKLQLEMTKLTEKEFIPPKAKQTMADMEFTIRRLKDEQRRLNEELRLLRKDSLRSAEVAKLGQLLGKSRDDNKRLRQELEELGGSKHISRSNHLKNLVWECVALLECGSECSCHPNFYRRKLVWDEYKIEFVTGREMVQCCHCWKLVTFDDFTVEHLKPKVMGGGDEMPNLRASCRMCNWTRPVEDISHKFNSSNIPPNSH